MADSIMDLIRKHDPEQNEKPYYIAEVGEFPRTKMNNMTEHLPLEDPDLFSEDPLDFEESAAMLREDVLKIYHFTMILNRFSEKFQQVSRALARGIAKLASCCVTKAVLEKKGFRFPKLEDVKIEGMYCMVSFNFRKCHAAIQATTNNNYLMWAHLVDIEFNWHTLAERLRATEEKIRRIREGKVNIDSMLSRAQMFRQQPASDKPRTVRDLLGETHPRSYPVIAPVVRGMLEKSKALQNTPSDPVPQTTEHKSAAKQPVKGKKHGKNRNVKALPASSEPIITANDKQKQEDEAYLDQIMRSKFEALQKKLDRAYNREKVPVPIGSASPGRA